MASIKVGLADKSVKAIVGATFPSYRGRKVAIEASEYPVDVQSYWTGGSRSSFAVVDLRNPSRTMAVPQNGTPFDSTTDTQWSKSGVVVPSGFAIVEHIIFCGKDLGIRIHVNPTDMPKFLAAA